MRIMGGRMKGRPIRCPRESVVRPVLGRLRESLFSALGDLRGLNVLDLFAGVGTLGFESISRGAVSATFVERDGLAVRYLRRNIVDLGIEECARVYSMDVYRFLGRLRARPAAYDIVFADPSYHQGDAERIVSTLAGLPGIASLIVVKHSFREELPIQRQSHEPLRILKRGDDRITILRGGMPL